MVVCFLCFLIGLGYVEKTEYLFDDLNMRVAFKRYKERSFVAQARITTFKTFDYFFEEWYLYIQQLFYDYNEALT